VSLLLDVGAFLAVEQSDRGTIALIKQERLAGHAPITHGGVLAQIWKGGGGRQAEVARLLRGIETVPLDEELARRSGMLMGRTGTGDASHAALVCLAYDGDVILTSDADGVRPLAEVAGFHIEIVPV
jgi:hypothetical protein